MIMLRTTQLSPAFVFLLCVGVAWTAVAQSSGAAASGDITARRLNRIATITAKSEVATEFAPPLRCDADGNLYLHSESFGPEGLRKVNSKGERLATFDPNPDSHLKTDLILSFALGRGDVYAIAYAHEEITRYLFTYDSDGKYKSTIKLDPGFAWQPAALAVFPSGQMLITGSRYVRTSDRQIMSVPFTGLFKPNGTLAKEIIPLAIDSATQKLADEGDIRYASTRANGANRAISFSQTGLGDDGNLYLMRWTNPAAFAVISPAGEVVRTFTVDPGDAELQPMSMHVSHNHIAVLFLKRNWAA